MFPKEPLVKYLISFAMAVAAALSGYYAAYTGLRVGLATKAEERYVAELDIRLARLEATINERFSTKGDLFDFKNEVVARLSAIETILEPPKAKTSRPMNYNSSK
jgi:hypothetical protein